MRILSFIFSIYIVALSCIPCCDSSECAKPSPTVTVQAESHSDHGHEFEICSPLCMCNCCGGITILTETKFAFADIIISELNTIFPDKKIHSIPFSIWQPPKIS